MVGISVLDGYPPLDSIASGVRYILVCNFLILLCMKLSVDACLRLAVVIAARLSSFNSNTNAFDHPVLDVVCFIYM